MLTFYHDLGKIIYFGSLSKEKYSLKDIVILDPQWLVDVFKQVITITDPDMVSALATCMLFLGVVFLKLILSLFNISMNYKQNALRECHIDDFQH